MLNLRLNISACPNVDEFFGYEDDPYNETASMLRKEMWEARWQEQFQSLHSYLRTEAIQVQNIDKECSLLYSYCLFSDAERCIKDKLISWNVFIVYLPIAMFLASIAIVFNSLSILLVTRVRRRFPRHALLINLSVSDTLLSLLTVIKRAADFLPMGLAKTYVLLYGNMVWQAMWLISAFGLMELAFDCFFATRFPFIYDKRATSIAIRSSILILWLCAFLLTGLLVFFELSYSNIVQTVICIMMAIILLAIVGQSIYAFTITETVSSFISWLPLVAYFMIDESVLTENVEMSQNLLAVCLVCFHMNAVVNPMVYSLRFKDVRVPLRRLLASSKLLKPLETLVTRLDDDQVDLKAQFQHELNMRRRTLANRNSSITNNNINNNSNNISKSIVSPSVSEVYETPAASAFNTPVKKQVQVVNSENDTCDDDDDDEEDDDDFKSEEDQSKAALLSPSSKTNCSDGQGQNGDNGGEIKQSQPPKQQPEKVDHCEKEEEERQQLLQQPNERQCTSKTEEGKEKEDATVEGVGKVNNVKPPSTPRKSRLVQIDVDAKYFV